MGVDRYLEAQHEALSQYPKVCEKLRKAEAERDLARRMAVALAKAYRVVYYERPTFPEDCGAPDDWRTTIERWREELGE
jgi:hypothetical protein